MAKSQNSIFAIVAIAVIAMAAGIFLRSMDGAKPDKVKLPEFEKLIVLPNPKLINGVDFTDQNGQRFTKQQLKGYWSIVFFGFTHCPDICPATMHTLKQVKASLAKDNKWGNYQVIMVSVDPARDTTEQLARYVPFFDETFIGLNSDLATTTEFAKQLGVVFVNRPGQNPDNYDVDHSAAVILLNPKGEMAGVFSAPHKVETIAKDLKLLARAYSDDHLSAPAKIEPKESAQENANSPAATETEESIEALKVQHAWIRPAPPSSPSMAAYLTLHNDSAKDITIVHVESDQFEAAMIHETQLNGDMSEMHHLDELEVPSKETVELRPGGLHIMLMQPERDFTAGEKIDLTLTTSQGKAIDLQLEIKNQTTL